MRVWTWFACMMLAAWPLLSLAQDGPATEPQSPPPGNEAVTTSEPPAGPDIKPAAELYTNDRTAAGARAALVEFEKLSLENPDDVAILSWLGFLNVTLDQPEQAIPPLERADSIIRGRGRVDPEILTNLGNAYMAARRFDDAERTYSELTGLSPNVALFWYNLGGFYLERNRNAEAITAYERALSIESGSGAGTVALDSASRPLVLNNLGRAHEKLGNLDRAEEYYVQAATADPSSRLFNRNAGVVLHKQEKLERALPYLEAALRDKPDDERLVLVLADTYIRLEREDEALDLLEPLQNSFDRNGTYWYNLGVLRARAGNQAGAQDAYERAEKIDPNDEAVLRNLGLIYFRKGQYADAEVRFRKVVQISGTLDNKLNLAAALSKTGKLAQAVEYWREYVRANPNRSDVRMDLANALWNLGDKQMARFHYSTVMQAEPNNVQAITGMGLWNLNEGNRAEAEKLFRRAITADTKYMPAYLNLAVTLERLNRRRDAIATLEDALEIDPNYEDGRRTLDRLRAATTV